MKLNNRGWGTMQMFLLSGGLLLALLVAVFFIAKFYGSFDAAVRNQQYSNLEAKLGSAAKEYIYTYNIEVTDSLRIDLNTLQSRGYIDNLKDKNGGICGGYVIVTKVDLTTEYKPYITCPNYQTNNY